MALNTNLHLERTLNKGQIYTCTSPFCKHTSYYRVNFTVYFISSVIHYKDWPFTYPIDLHVSSLGPPRSTEYFLYARKERVKNYDYFRHNILYDI